ncbi:divalent metal cation transporter [Frankia sp. R82]|nr:NRAMP family divalent metal transporter [Frankia sp. R82]MCM3883357.1 divalent metal cation transporter [Frankia sp. R82]
MERRTVLDRAHRGDVVGAWGTIPLVDTGPRTSGWRRLATFAAVLGPGVIVMVNDAGGLSLYAQAGQDRGYRLLWLVILLAPVLFVNQEMVARLGAVTGVGHARLIFERFGRLWGRFALADLLVLNALTLVTEFIGIALGCGYFGISRLVSVPLAAMALVGVTARGSFRHWERAMFAALLGTLAVVPLALLVQAHHPALAAAHLAATRRRPLPTRGVLFVVAMIGTTVSPWQLFFQQSNVVDKRVTSRWVRYARADIAVGTLLFVAGAAAALATCAAALHHVAGAGAGAGGRGGGFVDAEHTAASLGSAVGAWAGVLFAVVVLSGSLLGAAAVALSTSYAIGDASGLRHSLHRPWRQARAFHGSFLAMIVFAAAVVMIPGLPLGLLTLLVNVLAGVLLPSATVFLVLLCNDRAVLGPWTNPPWLNVLAAVIVGMLIVLSAQLVLTTLFPGLGVPVQVTVALVGLAGVVGATSALAWVRGPGCGADLSVGHGAGRSGEDRATWTMPPLETLGQPPRSRGRRAIVLVLRLYVLLALILVVIKGMRLLLCF